MFDIASLKIEGDATDLTKLIDGLDKLTSASQRYHTAGKRTKDVTEQANLAHRGLATDIQRLVGGTNAFSTATDTAAKAQIRAASATGSLASQQDRAARTAEMWLRRIENMEKALSPAAAVTNTLAQRTRDLDKAMVVGAIDADRYAATLAQVQAAAARGDEGMTRFSRGVEKGAAAAKLQGHELANLSFQLQDIIVSLASGQKPLTVALQQGSQIGQVFQVAGARGVGFGAIMRQLGGIVGGIATKFAPVGLAVGAVIGAFGLFERAIDKQTKHATSWGDTWTATLKVVGALIMKGPIGDGLRWLEKRWGEVLDWMTKAAFDGFTSLAATATASFKTIAANLDNLPGLIEAAFVGGVNKAIDALQNLANAQDGVIKGLRDVLGFVSPAMKPVLDNMRGLDLSRFKLTAGDAGKKAQADYGKFYREDLADNQKALSAFGSAVAKQADKEWEARQKQKKGLKDVETAAEKAAKATAAYIAGLEDEISKIGLTDAELRRLEANRQAAAAWARGDETSARRIRDLMLEREALIAEAEKYRALAESIKEAIEARDAFNKANIIPVRFEKGLPEAGKITPYKPDILVGLDEALEKARTHLDNVRYGIDDVYYGLKNKDWVGAAQGVIRAALAIRAAFDRTQGGGVAQGIGAVATAAGSAVGGKTGGVLTGVGSGMAAGAALGSVVPVIGTAIGAAIGGILGGIGGLLGANSAKRQARAQAAEEARNRALQIAADRLDMEVQLLGLQGKATEALARSRETEIAAMDASLRVLQEQLWAEEDAAKRRQFDIRILEASGKSAEALAASRREEMRALEDSLKPLQQAVWALEDLRDASDKLADRVKATRGLEADMLDAMGRSSEALAVRRALELEQMDAALRPLQSTVWALDDSRTAALKAGEALRSARDRMGAFSDSLSEFMRDLTFGEAANRSPVGQYDATRRNFERLSSLDANDPARLAGLQSASEAFLSASRNASPTSLAYNRDLMAVRRAVEASQIAAKSEVDIAQAELDRLDGILGGQGELIAATMTTTDAVNALRASTDAYGAAQVAAMAALGAQQAANAQATADLAAQVAAAQAQASASQAVAQAANSNKPAAFDAASYLSVRPDVLAEYQRHTSNSDIAYLASLGVYNAEGYAAWHNKTFNSAPGFATGGSFTVGGSGGPDSQFMPLRLTPGEMVDVRRPGQGSSGDVADEIRALNQTIASQSSELRAIRKAADQTQNELKTIRGRGLWVHGEDEDEPVSTAA